MYLQCASSAEAETLRGIRRLYINCKENSETCLYDGRGSVVQLLQGGTVSQSYSYNAYGYINTDDYGIQAPFYGYNGEQHDPATGLQYLRARYYAPQNGSFTTQDSFAGLLTDALSQNRYAYAQNNPVTFADPSGHSIWDSIRNGFTNAVNAVTNTVTSAYNTVKNTVTNAYNSARNAAINKFNEGRNTATNKFNEARNTAISGFNEARNTVISGFNEARNTVTSGFNKARNTVISGYNAVSSTMNSAVASLKNAYTSVIDDWNLTPDNIQDFAERAKSFMRRVCDAEAERIKIEQEVNYQTAKLSWDFIVSVGGKIGTGAQAVMQELERSFGAGATSVIQIDSVKQEIGSFPYIFTIGRKDNATIATTGDSSKPISFYVQERVDSIWLSSAGLKLNIWDYSLALNLGAENIGISISEKNDNVTNSIAVTANLTKFKVGIEQSNIIDMGNDRSQTVYTNFSFNGGPLLYAVCFIVLGSDITILQPALA